MQHISYETAQKQKTPTEVLMSELSKWKRDAKKFGQNALFDLLSDVRTHIKCQDKALEGKPIAQGFTRSSADEAFSNFIRKRDNYTCQKCGTKYEPKAKGLQCSHHFSRRYYNIRFDPDNAVALCYNCHNYWFQKDIPESARWLEERLGKAKIDRLIKLKNEKQTKPTASEELAIAEKYKEML